jgi:chromosome segregation ATPase
MLVNL